MLFLKGVVAALAVALNIDFGGNIIDRMQSFEMLERTNVTIPLSGVCISACTMFLGLSKVCVEPGTMFGFHSAYTIDEKGNAQMSGFGNALMLEYYPDSVVKWVTQTGALKQLDLTLMTAETAWKIGIPRCKK